jgi:hypothetical protein
MLSNHFLEWVILIASILAAIYCMIIIGSENSTYKEECLQVNFFKLDINIPKWWTQKESTKNSISFYRSDTNYAWEMKLSKIESNDINQYLSAYIDSEEIIYDEAETLVETESVNKILVTQTCEKIQNFIYIEGTATQKIETRIYLELVLIQLIDNETYFFENKSSVLNGAVEGPFFDELIKSIEVSS